MSIPATHAEIEELYLNAELKQCRSISITACNSQEGTSSVAQALTERYLLAGHKTLLVDLNLYHPSLMSIELPDVPPLSSELAPQSSHWVQDKHSPKVFLGVSAPSDPRTRLLYKDPTNLRQQVAEWLTQYDRVVIDTSPILNVNQNNIPAHCVANACDGTYLVVLSGATLTNQVADAVQALQEGTHTHLLGTVLNYRDQPSLANEICREIDRLGWLPAQITSWAKQKVIANRFLSLPI
ncbi:CpsD/CapB family tyrosine-protein kinase [Vibrio mediterranei]|uniref:CpsD/CapB family tyrosine-protein kinase n=1 Tax=Vibrio mediterranei TaxID=689 RepID=UPI001EFC36CA|nr:CpsD/CapB family tyrosine-protein kinase [Vibrio mediterranei]MCG9656391.1 CpsD/CapB family tyrosine-protein kinase [Vibrio mediterranei]